MFGEHCAPVRSDDAEPEFRLTTFFSLARLAIASADAGAGEIDEHVDLLDVDPLLADVDADVGLVLVIRRDQVDLPALGQQPEILDRHLRGDRRAGAADIGVEAGLVAEASDLDRLVELVCANALPANTRLVVMHQGCNGSFLHYSSKKCFEIHAGKSARNAHYAAHSAGRIAARENRPRVANISRHGEFAAVLRRTKRLSARNSGC